VLGDTAKIQGVIAQTKAFCGALSGLSAAKSRHPPGRFPEGDFGAKTTWRFAKLAENA